MSASKRDRNSVTTIVLQDIFPVLTPSPQDQKNPLEELLLTSSLPKNKKEWEGFLGAYIQALHVRYGYKKEKHTAWVCFYMVNQEVRHEARFISSWDLLYPNIIEYSESVTWEEYWHRDLFAILYGEEINTIDSLKVCMARRVAFQITNYSKMLFLWTTLGYPEKQNNCLSSTSSVVIKKAIADQKARCEYVQSAYHLYNTRELLPYTPPSVLEYLRAELKKEIFLSQYLKNHRYSIEK